MELSLKICVLLVPNQTGDDYVLVGLITDLYKSEVHSCLWGGMGLNKRVQAFLKFNYTVSYSKVIQ